MAEVCPSDIDLTGLIDQHIHSAPDVWPRFADDVDTVRAAAEAGMRAVLLKSHVTLTADRAAIAEKVVGGGIRVFGALALNTQVGGLNPAAVEAALTLGARQIWMPTQDAANHHRYEEKPGGISVLDGGGALRQEVREIVDLLRGSDAILGTGHLAVEETVALVRVAREMGMRKILVTHPEAPMIRMPVATQLELVGRGLFFERCFVSATSFTGATVVVADVADQIRRVGIESTVLSTDLGQAVNPAPTEGMRHYLACLLALGFKWEEIRRMAAENPATVLEV